MKALVIGAVLNIIGADAVAETPVFAGPYSGSVVRVIDGDTFEAQVEIWPNLISIVSVRVRGVDAPETRRFACPEEKEAGDRATLILAEELFERNEGGRVELDNVESDVWSGRVVADVFRPNTERRTELKGQLLAYDEILEWTPDQADIPWCIYFGAEGF